MNTHSFAGINRAWSSGSLVWVTRVLCVLYLAMTAFGWWDESRARQEPTMTGETQGDFLWQWAVFTHLLPLLVIVAATAVGWRRPAYGAIGFALYTVTQSLDVGTEWAMLPYVAALPLLITALYVLGWQRGARRLTHA